MSRAMRKLRLVLLAAAMGTGVALAQPTMEAATMQPRGATMEAATVTSAMVEAPTQAPATPAAVRSEADEARRARVYATIGDVRITVGRIEDEIAAMSPFLRARYRDAAKLRELADSLVRFELLAREAESAGYGDRPVVTRSVKQAIVQNLIKTEFDERITRESVTAEEVQAYYDAHAEEFGRPEMVRASHVLLATREEAQALLEEARAADARQFRELARRHSIDTETKLRGGDLRYFTRNGLPAGAREDDTPVDPAIVEATFSLGDVGSVVTEPIAVGEHWSLVKLTGRRAAEQRTVEQASEGIRLRLWREKRQHAIDEFVDGLRRDHPPEIHADRMRPIRLDNPPPGAASLPNGHPQVGGSPGMHAPGMHAAPAE
ncbi:MAG: peptidyl-prolyl cis-trans isomerase [Sandaracinus sp.]|nr:peptidyl-prolyl cis-trans isomerase [Sandaracinus sp.]